MFFFLVLLQLALRFRIYNMYEGDPPDAIMNRLHSLILPSVMKMIQPHGTLTMSRMIYKTIKFSETTRNEIDIFDHVWSITDESIPMTIKVWSWYEAHASAV